MAHAIAGGKVARKSRSKKPVGSSGKTHKKYWDEFWDGAKKPVRPPKPEPTIALVKIVKKPATARRGEIISFEIIASGVCAKPEVES
jgi:hypothetical protein